MLGAFQSDLSTISDEIKMLQGDSLAMNVKLRNRRALQSLMSEYVSSVVVSPQLVRQICEEEINEQYLDYLTELNKKLDHVKQNDMQKFPSCAQSAPELERLRTKAVSRIKDFLLQKINALKKPKTNLQILQRNVLVRFKFFNVFLLSITLLSQMR
jgi:DNA repair ATPase RecN